MTEHLPYTATTLSAAYEGIDRLPVSLLLDNVRSLYNVGAFFRSADAAGLDHLYLCGYTGHPPSREIAKTALGAETAVAWSRCADPLALLERLATDGVELAAIETSVRAVDLFDWEPRFPICVLFGNEVEGLRAELLERCDTHVRLPMLGVKHSLNVATAGGVVAYELLRKYRHRLELAPR